MAINVSFNGATIYKPGAYSKTEIDLGGGFPLSPTGIVAIFGESSSGIPGALVPNIANNVYSPNQMTQIAQIYGSGPLVDACQFLFSPGADGAIPGGAQAVYIYKTNQTTQAQMVLGSNWGTVLAQSWGTAGNLITYQNTIIPPTPASTSSSTSFNITSGLYNGAGGTAHLNDADAQNAMAAANAAFTSMEGMTATPISATLDGQTLTPGVYSTGAGALATSGPGTLTFNGAGVYIISTASTLTTGAGGVSTMALTNGATAANIYWVVGSSATINSGSAGTFQGNIIAETAITDTTGGTVNGSMIALNAAVTFSAATTVNAQYSPLLNAAGSWAVLASSTITNTGVSHFNGSVGVSPGTSVTLGGAIINDGAGASFIMRLNGASPSLDNTFTTSGSILTVAELQTALTTAGNWSLGLPSGIVFTVSGTNTAAFLNIAEAGAGEFELINGSPTSLLGNGAGKFNILPGLVTPETLAQASITITNYGTNVTETDVVGGNVIMEIGRVGGVAPTVTINATNIILTNNAVAEYTIPLSNFNTVAQLALFITTSTGGVWNAVAGTVQNGQLSPSLMDKVTAVGAAATSTTDYPAQITNNAAEVAAFFAQSSNVSLVQVAGQGTVGLPPTAGPVYLTGGTVGGTPSSEIANALNKFTKFRVNSVVPLFSRNASADILDGLTDPSSTYVIDAIHQAVKTHLSLMSTTKNKSERQGYLSMKDTYANCKTEIANMAYSRIQMVIQDILNTSFQDVLQWYLPWAGACLLAGARGGSPVGNPMTFKYFNMSGIRQTAQPMTTPNANIVIGFDPDIMYDDAIQSGVTFWEAPQSGGFRLVVDNTTYNTDGNWVFNRANVQYAADVVAFDFRTQLENIYVGLKNTTTAAAIMSTCQSILATYLAQGITVSTSDAKSGYKQLIVQINGNVVNISVVVKLVEGIDFILADITLQRATSTT
jgi:type VI secretion system secreted protein VgrG